MDSDDKRLTQIIEVTSLSDSDLFLVSVDVGTAPKTRRIKKSNAAPALKQMILGNCLNGTVPASSTYYAVPGAVITTQASSFNMEITAACTISNLRFTTSSAQPASGSLVVTVNKNNVNTALTVTIAANAAPGTAADTTHSVSFSAGDLVIIEIKNNATGASATISRNSLLVTFT